ncbi:SRPBCC family protein [Streptomyces sp. ID01-12c]|uniref:SRPBCC family protein n=1 Tax=Streptomyces caniscabiei TaxID=2746961 RepID=UPI00177C803A|nr:SRPBCC family protein [Streptomyces caniscabiei]MBD9703080.1 SRPBCC family protein [Streptomyces caniscabiei]MDX3732249.1 SRPBCC family protein [Streptomyces caniscabiei]
MAERGTTKGGSAGGTGTLDRTEEESDRNTGTTRLKEELEDYIEARLSVMLQGVGHGLGEGARKLGDMGTGALTSTASHAKDALIDKAKGATGKAKDVVGDKAKDATGNAKDVVGEKAGGVMEKAKDAVGGKKGGRKPEGGSGKGHTIIEDIDVGVPVREAYDQWTQFQEFSRFAKGVVAVDQQDETTTQWHVKIAKSTRSWRGNITEQVPDERIAWTSEGAKATTRGVVTFHPLGDNLTKVLLVLEYFPKGVVEKVGGLFRAQGRRARLDLKLYRTFVMMRGEATGGWRGEIRDGEVQEPEDDEETEEETEEGTEDAEGRHDEDEPEAEREDRPEEDEWEDEGEDTDEDSDEYAEDEEPEEDEDEEPEDAYEDDEEPVEDEDEEPRREAR